MKIALAQQNYHIGNFEDNSRKIIEGINWAKKQQADLVVFSELCVCGYPPRDFLDFRDFIDKCYEAIDVIKHHADTIGVLVGALIVAVVLWGTVTIPGLVRRLLNQPRNHHAGALVVRALMIRRVLRHP